MSALGPATGKLEDMHAGPRQPSAKIKARDIADGQAHLLQHEVKGGVGRELAQVEAGCSGGQALQALSLANMPSQLDAQGGFQVAEAQQGCPAAGRHKLEPLCLLLV